MRGGERRRKTGNKRVLHKWLSGDEGKGREGLKGMAELECKKRKGL